MKAVLSLDFKHLCDLLDSQGHKNLVPTAREWGQLVELVEILEPFAEATSLTESDQTVTLSYALPSILSLMDYLEELMPRLKYCSPICKSLVESIQSRFEGLLKRVVTDAPVSKSLPFGSDVYVIAAFFDPKFKLQWIDNSAAVSDTAKIDLRKHVTGIQAIHYILHYQHYFTKFAC